MNQVLGERVFRVAEGTYRVRITRNHPTSGRFVPGVRFMAFEDLEGRTMGIAGVHPTGATIDLETAQLERLLQMAQRCQMAASLR